MNDASFVERGSYPTYPFTAFAQVHKLEAPAYIAHICNLEYLNGTYSMIIRIKAVDQTYVESSSMIILVGVLVSISPN